MNNAITNTTGLSKWLAYAIAALSFFLFACEKPAGPGGKARVIGKVFAHDFDNTQQYEVSAGYSAGETVYICYGTNTEVGNTVKTSFDGSFNFLYLNKGHYKVFVLSLDTTIKLKGNATKVPIIKEFEITSPKQTIDLGDLVINK